jgi:geranylgeranyl reductase family protein
MKIWDAMIVGAGPAGCAAAYDLACSGQEVLLFDRATFPRQKACAGGLTLKAVEALRYPIDPVIRERVDHIRIEKDPSQNLVLRRQSPYCFMTVRKDLDDFCFRQTVAAGAHFQQIGAISAIEETDEGVTTTVDGETFHGRFLIGADGVHSQVRKLTEKDPRWFWRGFALEATVSVTNPEREELIFDFAPIREGYGWSFPKGDHLNVGLYSYSKAEKIDRTRLGEYVRTRFGDTAAPAEVIGQYAGFGAPQHEVPATRVFLTGDAGGFVDPLTGEGIYFAIASGQAAAAAIQSEIHGRGAAHLHFSKLTAQMRSDLGVAASAGRWFYANLDQGFHLLAIPGIRSVAAGTFASGLKLARLATRVRRLRNALS